MNCNHLLPLSRGICTKNLSKLSFSKANISSRTLRILTHHNGATSTLREKRPCCQLDDTDKKLGGHRSYWRDTLASYTTLECTPIKLAHDALVWTHDVTGLPWWASIALTTFALRTMFTVPLTLYSMHNQAKLSRLGPEIQQLAKDLKMEVAFAAKKYQWSNKMAEQQFISNMKRHISNLYIRDNCHPLKTFIVGWTQVPLWISLSLAMRNMAGFTPFSRGVTEPLYGSMAEGGTLWFTNLLIPDPTLLLPAATSITMLLNIELMALRKEKTPTFIKVFLNISRLLSLSLLAVGCYMPSLMPWYWFLSSSFSLVQNLFMMTPTARRVLHLPKMPNQSETPFQDLWAMARKKYSWRTNTQEDNIAPLEKKSRTDKTKDR